MKNLIILFVFINFSTSAFAKTDWNGTYECSGQVLQRTWDNGRKLGDLMPSTSLNKSPISKEAVNKLIIKNNSLSFGTRWLVKMKNIKDDLNKLSDEVFLKDDNKIIFKYFNDSKDLDGNPSLNYGLKILKKENQKFIFVSLNAGYDSLTQGAVAYATESCEKID